MAKKSQGVMNGTREEEENKYQIGSGDIDNRTIKVVRIWLFVEQLVE